MATTSTTTQNGMTDMTGTVFYPEPCAHCDAHERALDTFVANPNADTAGVAIDLGPCEIHSPSPTWADSWLHPSERKHAPRTTN